MSETIADDAKKSPSPRQVALVSLVGTTIEWYDFQIYGLASALVFGELFFPSFSPVAGTLLAFATFGIGFLARPVGSVVFGHLGDRFGRRKVLMVALVMMGSATFLIGCMPTYDQLGIAAPVILVALRLVQGIGLGGEWGGAAVYAIESAPSGRRGRYGGWPQMGSPLGLLIATTAFTLIGFLSEDQLQSWGWRIPFLASALLIVIGAYMRRRLEDTPSFKQAQRNQQLVRFPLGTLLRDYRRELLLTFGMFSATAGGFYMFVTFIPAYVKNNLDLGSAPIDIGLFGFAILELLAVWFATTLTDRVGRRPPFIVCGVIAIVIAYPLYWIVESGSAAGIVVVLLIGGVLIGVMFGIPGALAPEQFPAEVRYSGAGFGYQVSAAIVGGLTPVMTTAGADAANSTWPVAALLAFFIAVGVVAVVCCRETGRAQLRENRSGSSASSDGEGTAPAEGGTDVSRH